MSENATLNFGYAKSKYAENMFTDKDLFIKKLSKMLKKSREYVEDLSKSHIREQVSLNRLIVLCKQRKLSLDLPNESRSVYDCIINGYKIQNKTTSCKKVNMYKLGIGRVDEMINGKRKMKPYADTDNIDFVIAEIIDEENNFYIIPRFELITRGIFSSEGKPGLATISIPPENYEGPSKYKWLLKYRNNWDLISK